MISLVSLSHLLKIISYAIILYYNGGAHTSSSFIRNNNLHIIQHKYTAYIIIVYNI